MTEEDFGLDPVLINTFVISSKRCRVYFRRNVLIWETANLPVERNTVPICDIIAVDYEHGKDCNCIGSSGSSSNLETFHMEPGSPPASHHRFVVHYGAERAGNRWRLQAVTLEHGDQPQVSSWLKTLRNALAAQRLRRPRKVLAFVNPFCGKRKGVEIYRKTVQPVLGLAGVEAELVVTEHGGHAREVIAQLDLKQFDAVLTVGGDGTVSEVLNALVLRRARDAGVDEHDFGAEVPRVDIPLAIVPGGSTDTIAYCLNGTLDRETAALYAVLGDQAGLDVCSVHSARGLCRYFLSLLGYGFLGDVLKESEKHRWMGPRRYDYAGFLKFLKNKRYHLEVDMVLAEGPAGGTSKCFKNCELCGRAAPVRPAPRYQEKNLLAIRSDLRLLEAPQPERRLTVRGKYFLVGCANISCACVRSPNGIAPHCHLGDGAMDVLLFRPGGYFEVLKMLVASSSKKDSVAVTDLPFAAVHKAREVTVRVLNQRLEPEPRAGPDGRSVGASVWNCDGEVVRDSNLRVKCFRQLVRVLTRRHSPALPKVGSSCWGCLGCASDASET